MNYNSTVSYCTYTVNCYYICMHVCKYLFDLQQITPLTCETMHADHNATVLYRCREIKSKVGLLPLPSVSVNILVNKCRSCFDIMA